MRTIKIAKSLAKAESANGCGDVRGMIKSIAVDDTGSSLRMPTFSS
jgi:hypothetical protein